MSSRNALPHTTNVTKVLVVQRTAESGKRLNYLESFFRREGKVVFCHLVDPQSFRSVSWGVAPLGVRKTSETETSA